MTFPPLRVLAAWLLIIGLESLNGTARRLWLIPTLGESRAAVLGFVIGAIIIFGVAILVSRWLGMRDRQQLLITGLIWAALTLAFEIALGRFVTHASWSQIFAEYDVTRGGLMSLGMLILVLAPSIAYRVRSAAKSR